MAGRKTSTQEIKAESEGVLAKMRDRSFPMAVRSHPQASPEPRSGEGPGTPGRSKNSAREQACPQSAALGGLITELWKEGIHG